MAARIKLVAKKPRAWPRAIRDPQIQIAISIPVHHSHSAAIVGQIKPRDRGDIGKILSTKIQKTAMAFVAAKGASRPDHRVDRGPRLEVVIMQLQLLLSDG